MGTSTLALIYFITNAFELVGYDGGDYTRCQIDKKSTSGVCAFMGQSLISWLGKTQICVTLYTAEGEYLVVHIYCS